MVFQESRLRHIPSCMSHEVFGWSEDAPAELPTNCQTQHQCYTFPFACTAHNKVQWEIPGQLPPPWQFADRCCYFGWPVKWRVDFPATLPKPPKPVRRMEPSVDVGRHHAIQTTVVTKTTPQHARPNSEGNTSETFLLECPWAECWHPSNTRILAARVYHAMGCLGRETISSTPEQRQ